MEFLHNVFNSCAESNNWDFAHYVFFTHWPTKAQSLEYYLSVSEDRIRKPKFWRARHRPLACEGFTPERLGLLMRKAKFDLVKSILRDCYLADTSKDPDLLSLLNPYVVLYACMDLDLPLPPSFDLKFLWDHLSELIDATRTADLVRDDEIPSGTTALQLIPFQPPEPGLDDETIKALYAHYHLGKYPQTRLHVYVAASDMGTGVEAFLHAIQEQAAGERMDTD
ncbi:hypothetical protein EWM64_g379 [Hericium alpestre]|uniref:Uncharacterized protein n=1 Tax=Hericium alpestre TaxID=135208 RepID=A0A4Z0ABB8_9AGAM|nr:hypothetical protein EWM64_g379 [Hericium alpestre]